MRPVRTTWPLRGQIRTNRRIGGRAGSAADAMRSTPSQGAAGNRARRFLAATSAPVIRVAEPYARRIGAPGVCRPHASVVAAAANAYESGAVSRRAERRQPTTRSPADSPRQRICQLRRPFRRCSASGRPRYTGRRRSAAASSVSSFFAKQKRSTSGAGSRERNGDVGIDATPCSLVRRIAKSASDSELIAE